jgi:uncharacterized membrane protein YeaQ/YmgE (transglycosylase-associated protein family)
MAEAPLVTSGIRPGGWQDFAAVAYYPRRTQRSPPAGRGENHMSIVAWVVLGLIAGFIGSKLVNKRGEGLVLDIVLGVVGAVVGGSLFNMLGMSGVTGLNLYSLLVAVVGAMLVLVVFHVLFRRS